MCVPRYDLELTIHCIEEGTGTPTVYYGPYSACFMCTLAKVMGYRSAWQLIRADLDSRIIISSSMICDVQFERMGCACAARVFLSQAREGLNEVMNSKCRTKELSIHCACMPIYI